MNDAKPTRRDFVRTTAVSALALSLGCGDDSSEPTADGSTSTGSDPSTSANPSTSGGSAMPTSSDPATSSGSTGSPGSSSGGADSTGTDGPTTGGLTCDATDDDIEGPFYRPGIPVRDNLDIYDDPGIPLVLQGQVLDGNCQPLPNAVVEVWQASPRPPKSQPGDADATYDASEDFRYYGQTATDRRGRYQFTTLVPGWYLNGAQYRPAHLHIKVWIRDQELLTTQLYFEGDPFNRADTWFNPDNMLTPDPQGQATYDFHVVPG
ncbi:MAG: hypothetical protein K0V04_06665 [Deltaproteobacteria bacterium]|nr:hypothetical protein [Deltaproteobacteria bacterium]